MSQKRSVWKNRPDGKTVKRNAVAQFYTSRPVELLNSPAFRVISRAAHLALARIEIELGPLTFSQFFGFLPTSWRFGVLCEATSART